MATPFPLPQKYYASSKSFRKLVLQYSFASMNSDNLSPLFSQLQMNSKYLSFSFNTLISHSCNLFWWIAYLPYLV